MPVGPREALKGGIQFTLLRGFAKEGGLCLHVPNFLVTICRGLVCNRHPKVGPPSNRFILKKSSYKKVKGILQWTPVYLLPTSPIVQILHLLSPNTFFLIPFKVKYKYHDNFIPQYFILKYIPQYFLWGRTYSYTATIPSSHPGNLKLKKYHLTTRIQISPLAPINVLITLTEIWSTHHKIHSVQAVNSEF